MPIVLDNGDKIRGDASAATVVDYTIHGAVSTTPTQLADGQLAATIGDLYTSAAIVTVVSIILVNTDSSARTVNLYLTPSGGTARRLIPKNLSLGAGYSLHTDGQKCSILDTTGQMLMSWSLASVGITATAVELNYSVGVTSAIQTQLNLKAPLASPTFTGAANFGSGVLRAIAPDLSGVVTAASALTLPAHTSGIITTAYIIGSYEGTLRRGQDDQYIEIWGGTDENSAKLTFFGKTYSYAPYLGSCQIYTPNAALVSTLRFLLSGGVDIAKLAWTNCKQVFDATSLPNGDPTVAGQLYYTAADGIVRRSAG